MSGRDPPRPHPPWHEQDRQYFVPGWGISRQIIFTHVRFSRRLSAVRPYTYRGREGYLVTSPSSVEPLTALEIAELRNRSRQHELRIAETPPVPPPIDPASSSTNLNKTSSIWARIRRKLKDKIKLCNPRWCTFGLMFLAGLAVMLSGMISLRISEWKQMFVVFYSTWVLATFVLVLLNMEYTGRFVLHCFQYMLCISVSLWFSSSVLRIDSNVLYIYFPICTDIGVFLGLGVDHMFLALGLSDSAAEDQDRMDYELLEIEA